MKTKTILLAVLAATACLPAPAFGANAAAQPRLLEPLKLLAYDPANRAATEGELNKFYLRSANPKAWEQVFRARDPMLNSSPLRKIGDYASFAFKGGALEVYSYLQSPCGFANIHIDGAFKKKVDLWNRGAKPESLIYRIDGLDPDKIHTFKMEVAGNSRNPDNANINIQYVKIYDAPVITSAQAFDERVFKTGTPGIRDLLPAKARVHTASGDFAEVRVNWRCPGFNESKPGQYIFTGDFSDVKWPAIPPGLKAQIKVVVAADLRTVSFDTGGGTPAAPVTRRNGGVIENAPAAKKFGYEIAGWFSDSALTREITFPFTVTGDTTLYAKWKEGDTKAVTFKVADATGAPLAGARVTVNGGEAAATTGADGAAVIKLPNADTEYAYTVARKGYFDALRKLAVCSSCPAGVTENITMRAYVPWFELLVNNFESNDPQKNRVKFSKLVRYYNTGPGWYLVGESRNPGVYRTFSSDVHISFTAGDWFEHEFTGGSVRLFVVRNPDSGLAKVTVDGAHGETIDCYGPEEPHGIRNESYQLVYERHNLGDGPHKLRLEVLGKKGAGKKTNVLFDFIDHADYPVFERFNRPPSAVVDVTPDSAEFSQRLVTAGPGGLASVQEAGFVIVPQSERRAPTINDIRLPAKIDADGRFNAVAKNLKPHVLYVVQPYAVVKGVVYYGVEPRTVALLPAIVLNNEIIGRLPGATVTLQVNKLPANVPAIKWSVVKQHKYDGTPADDIIGVTFNGNTATITTKNEGQAIVRATSTTDPAEYADCEVTVARTEKNPRLARTPPMGWATWGEYVRSISKDLMYEQADAMVATIPSLGFSLKDAGYEYLVMDGGWRQDWLEPDGRLVPDYHSFGGVDGMKNLFDYIHKLGLKTGLHNTPGYGDCAGQPSGTVDNPQLIMAQMVDWGIDFIKWDHCDFGAAFARSQSYDRSLFVRTKYHMDNCGRDVLYYICVGNGNGVFKDWCVEIAHAWLTLRDIATMGNNNHNGGASWNTHYGTFSTAIYEAALFTATLSDLAGPANWNDPNFIPVGDAGLNLVENQSTFNLWCMLSSALLLSGDLRKMIHDAELMKIVTNKELLAIDKDTLKAGKRIKATSPAGKTMNAAEWKNFNEDSVDIWARPLSDGTWAVMLVNNTPEPRDITVTWREVIYDPHHKMTAPTYTLRDLATHTDLGPFTNTYTARSIPPHGTVVLKATPARTP